MFNCVICSALSSLFKSGFAVSLKALSVLIPRFLCFEIPKALKLLMIVHLTRFEWVFVLMIFSSFGTSETRFSVELHSEKFDNNPQMKDLKSS